LVIFSKKEMREKIEGFTLIELLIVIGIMIILGTIVVFAMNPGERLRDARDNQRKAHVEAIYGALKSYNFREESFPGCVQEEETDAKECEPYIVPEHIASMPKDPVEGVEGETGYMVKKHELFDDAGVKAVHAEGEEEIIAGFWE